MAKTALVAVLLALLASACDAEREEGRTLSVRLVADLSGPTRFVGESFHAGRVDRLRAIEERGGIRGHRIVVESADTAHDPRRTFEQFLAWKNEVFWSDVVTFFGYDADSALALGDRIAEARIPFFSRSFLGRLGAPKPISRRVSLEDGTMLEVENGGAPHHFAVGADYSSAMRASLEFIAERGGRRIAFAHCTEAIDCTDPLVVGKAYARGRLGMTVEDDLVIELSADETSVATSVSAYLADHPDLDWIWIANTRETAAAIVRAARGSEVRFMANVWAMDEGMDEATQGGARERLFGVVAARPYGDLVRSFGMQELVQIHDAYRPPSEHANMYYVLGYATVVAWEIAVSRVLGAGEEVTRDSIQAALERSSDVATGGLLPTLSFTADDHRPTTEVRIHGFDASGALRFEERTKVERRDDWLGW